MNVNEKFRRCPVCGYYYDDFYPWGKNGDSASFDICICCGAEWGYDDTPEQKNYSDANG